MNRRILIILGSLVVLASAWIVTWDKYQDSITTPEEKRKGTKSEKAIKYKRFPATQKKITKVITRSNNIPKSTGVIAADAEKYKVSTTKFFRAGQSDYVLVENLKVLDLSHRAAIDKNDIVAEKFKKILVKAESVRDDFFESGRVLKNKRTKRLAIMTGVFKIKLINHESWSDLRDDYELTLEANFPGIRLSLLKTENLEQVGNLFNQISKDSRVERVELEILEAPDATR